MKSFVIKIHFACMLCLGVAFGPVQAQDLRLVIQSGHNGEVDATAFSPDSKLIATGSLNGDVRVWGVDSGKLLRVLSGLGSVRSISFSPTGKFILVDYCDNKTCGPTEDITVWKLATGEEILSEYQIHSVNFGSDDDAAMDLSIEPAEGESGGRFIGVMNLSANSKLQRISIDYSVERIFYENSSNLLITQDTVNNARVYDSKSLTLTNQIKGDFRRYVSGRKAIIEAGDDKSVKLIDLQTNEIIYSKPGRYLEYAKYLFTLEDNGSINVWEISNGTAISTLKVEGVRPEAPADRPIEISADGKKLIARGPITFLFDVGSGKLINQFKDLDSVLFSPDGQTFLAFIDLESQAKGRTPISGDDESDGVTPTELVIVQSSDGKIRRSFRNVSPGYGYNKICSAAFSADSTLVTLPKLDGGVEILKRQDLTQVRSFPPFEIGYISRDEFAGANHISARNELFSTLGLAVESFPRAYVRKIYSITKTANGLTLRNSSTKRLIRSFPGYQNYIFSDSQKYVALSKKGVVSLWGLDPLRPIKTFVGHEFIRNQEWLNPREIYPFSPDESVFVTRKEPPDGFSRSLHVFQTLTGEKWEVPGAEILAGLSFSHDSRTIAISTCGSMTCGTAIYEAQNGAEQTFPPDGSDPGSDEVRTFEDVPATDGAAMFSEDDSLLVLGGSGGQIYLFDSKTQKLVSRADDLSPEPYPIALSCDNRILITGNAQSEVVIWNVEPKALSRIASAYVSPNKDWVVVTPEGRFDTNKSLDNIDGLHWVVSGDPLTPLPLEIFMREYYEPGLLRRVLKCTADNTCDKDFKPLPPIGQINRVQPGLGRPRISEPNKR